VSAANTVKDISAVGDLLSNLGTFMTFEFFENTLLYTQ